jgi:hypothetical protein
VPARRAPHLPILGAPTGQRCTQGEASSLNTVPSLPFAYVAPAIPPIPWVRYKAVGPAERDPNDRIACCTAYVAYWLPSNFLLLRANRRALAPETAQDAPQARKPRDPAYSCLQISRRHWGRYDARARSKAGASSFAALVCPPLVPMQNGPFGRGCRCRASRFPFDHAFSSCGAKPSQAPIPLDTFVFPMYNGAASPAGL